MGAKVGNSRAHRNLRGLVAPSPRLTPHRCRARPFAASAVVRAAALAAKGRARIVGRTTRAAGAAARTKGLRSEASG
jgi:hypothetical protein